MHSHIGFVGAKLCESFCNLFHFDIANIVNAENGMTNSRMKYSPFFHSGCDSKRWMNKEEIEAKEKKRKRVEENTKHR